MRNVFRLSAKSLMLVGAVAFSGVVGADPADAINPVSHHTETINFPTFDPGSEGNFPSVCDGQVGYWTQIPMPGGKTFCVLHFTEFFKGGSGTGGEQICVYTRTVWSEEGDQTEVVKTIPGACTEQPSSD